MKTYLILLGLGILWAVLSAMKSTPKKRRRKRNQSQTITISFNRQPTEPQGIKLLLDYRDFNGNQTERQVIAYQLGYVSNRHYVIAYCLSKREERHFKTDRIISCVNIETGEIITDIIGMMRTYNPQVVNLSDEFDNLH